MATEGRMTISAAVDMHYKGGNRLHSRWADTLADMCKPFGDSGAHPLTSGRRKGEGMSRSQRTCLDRSSFADTDLNARQNASLNASDSRQCSRNACSVLF